MTFVVESHPGFEPAPSEYTYATLAFKEHFPILAKKLVQKLFWNVALIFLGDISQRNKLCGQREMNFKFKKVMILAVFLLAAGLLYLSWNGVEKFQIAPGHVQHGKGHQNRKHKAAHELTLKPVKTETEILNDANYQDSNRHASGKFSKLFLIEKSHVYGLNETVNIRIVLKDRKSKPKTRGGDMLVVWMKDRRRKASSAGYVIDHDNGTYTGVLRTMWTGQAVIYVAILSSRERMTFIYKTFRTGFFGKHVYCLFDAQNITETTEGYLDERFLKKETLCNLTAENWGVPFYCTKPEKHGFECHHWSRVNTVHFKPVPTEADTSWYRSCAFEKLQDWIHIRVSSVKAAAVFSISPCGKKRFRDSWVTPSPIGFFCNSTWRQRKCFNILSTNDYHQCLTNRSLRVFGDSTVRQFFTVLYKTLNLKMRTGPWFLGQKLTSHKRYYYMEAYEERHNYTVAWIPHGLPMSYFNANRTAIRPVFVRLDEIPSGSSDIILINLYAHFNLFPVHIFRDQLKRTRISIQKLLTRSPNIKLAIKGPHNYIHPISNHTLGGLWGPIYESIIKQEFVALYDRVFYLDVWDMTIAVENANVHPDEHVVSMMIHTFLGYLCVE
ncbi:NXPE family member 3-like [Haliotis asinina]|uniref:NXPE family member 3-like n=1 Tax=Haliotis asinina TaxID=109174 RepID=UPI003531D39E